MGTAQWVRFCSLSLDSDRTETEFEFYLKGGSAPLVYMEKSVFGRSPTAVAHAAVRSQPGSGP